MPLLKIKDFDPDYKNIFGGYDIKDLNVYSDINSEKIGKVEDLLVDEQGYFRYLIVDLGFWGFGKKVLLPVGYAQVDSEGKHIYATGFTKEQAEHLPEFSEDLRIDRNYEERVRGVYRPSREQSPVRQEPMSYSNRVESIPPTAQPHPQARVDYGNPSQPQPVYDRQPVENGTPTSIPSVNANHSTSDPDSYYDYRQDNNMYGMDDRRHSILRRYEERLQAKRRHPDRDRL